jgi:competence protein ComGC
MGSVRALTLVEVLFLLIVVAVLAALLMPILMPPLSRVNYALPRSGCRANLHNIGLALGQWQADNDQEYPVTVDYTVQENIIANAFGRIYSVGYCNDEDVFVCLSTEKKIELPAIDTDRTWTENAEWIYKLIGAGGHLTDNDQDYVYLLNSSYNYDNARIDKNSAAGRIIAGDGLRRQWMRNASQPLLDSAQKVERVEPNHDDGANVVCHDKAVIYVKRTLQFKRWIPYQADAMLAGSTTSLETEPDRDARKPGPDRPFLGDNYDWVRQGVIQNPRIEEDGIPNDADEHDDAYAIEGVPSDSEIAGQWWMLSEFQFETGILIGGKDWLTDGHGRIIATKGSVEGMERVPKSKIDASIQPFRHYRPGTGWPDDNCLSTPPEQRLPIGNREAGDIWTY